MSKHTAAAPPPGRASNSFVLAWGGLINITLSAYGGKVETKVARKEFVEGTDVQVGRTPYRKDTGEVIETATVERKAQATNGTWVIFTDDEVVAATCPKGTADIVAFVPVKDVGQYLTEDVIQVRPKTVKGRPDPSTTKAFALLATAMRKTRTVALVKLALRGPARYGLLTPDGDLLWIYTADAIRAPRPLDIGKFDAREVTLAVSLIENIGISAPVVTDDTAEAIQKAVDAKAGGKPTPTPTTTPEDTQDLLAALQASLRPGGVAA